MLNPEPVADRRSSITRCMLLGLLFVLTLSAISLSQTFTVLHTFNGDDGSSPFAGVSVDHAGNLYGTTKYGGIANCDLGCGMIYKLARQGSGWSFAPLYKFAGPSDGKAPLARVVFGPDGRLYGTTSLGGSLANAGTVFSLAPPPNICRAFCYWVKTTLWSFAQSQDDDGHVPGYGDLVFDGAGSIYGTTEEGGPAQPNCGPGCGTVYMLSSSGGAWIETLIYLFGDGPGYHPLAGVTFDGNGNLYGTTPLGGSDGWGLVYQLSYSEGIWSPAILHNFLNQDDGGAPNAGLVVDSTGTLYGATSTGGAGTRGTIFKLFNAGQDWTLQPIYSFDSLGQTFATLTMDAAGNLYGADINGGMFGHGYVYKLTRTGDSWTYTTLYDFTGGGDGSNPYGTLALDEAGNIYGTAEGGGSTEGQCLITSGCGVIWRISQ